MRVVIVEGGEVQAEMTSEMSSIIARNTQFPFRTRCRLLAWMQARSHMEVELSLKW
jgi:hypothetical protein